MNRRKQRKRRAVCSVLLSVASCSSELVASFLRPDPSRESENSNDDSWLARGLVDSASVGGDFGELSRLFSAQFRLALPAGPRGDFYRRLPPGVLHSHLFRSARAVQRI